MRSQTAICSALLLSGALCGAGLRADDRTFGSASPPQSELPVMISRQEADAARTVAPAQFDAPVITAGLAQPGTASADVRTAAPAALRHCSVVGAVRMPGTYAGSEDSVLLRTLIDHAGGLTEQASGIVRILNGGRQQSVNLASSLGAVIVPANSVIVVESAAAGPHAAEFGAQPYIDVACMQLCERPVVLCLDPADATVPQILQLLGQPPELAQSVRVLAPASGHGLPADSLVSGSVVVFDPDAVNRASLADVLSRWPLQDVVKLPSRVQPQVAADAIGLYQFLGGEQTPTEQIDLAAADAETVTDRAPAAALFTPAGIDTAVINEEPDLTAPAPLSAPGDGSVHPASAVQLRSPSGPRTVPRDLSANMEAGPSEVESIHEPPADADAVAESFPVMEELPPADEVLPAASDPPTQWARFGSSFAAWLLCGLAGYGVFRIWMRQHDRRPQPAPLPAPKDEIAQPAVARDAKTPLSLLIDKSLPFREEETPALAQTFHGRTVGFRYLVRSGPHPLQGPHFAVSGIATTEESSTPATASSAGVTQRTERGTFRFDAAVESQSRERGPTAAPRSGGRNVSPLERALRSVLREGRDSAP